MKISSLHLLKACTVSVALLGSAALVAVVSVPDTAFAKSGNDNGNSGGNGNGNSGGNGNGNGNSGGNGNSKAGSAKSESSKSKGTTDTSTKSKAKTKTKTKTKAASKKKTLADELGVSPSELGALNAANANPNALKNASPNSRVGRIAAYRDAVVAGQELEADLAAKEAILATLTAPDSPSSDIAAELVVASEDTATKAAIVSQLEADLEAAGGSDPVIEDALSTARDNLTAAELAEAALEDELADAVEYETVSAEVDELADQLEDQPETERALLEAAANKPVTDAVEAAVKKLLGL